MKFQMNKLNKVEKSLEVKRTEEEIIRKLSNMRHSSNKRSLKKVKSRYLEYESYGTKSPATKLNNQLLEFDPTSRKNLNKSDTKTFVPKINK